MFDPQLAGEFSCVIGLRTGEAELRAVLDASVLSVAPGNIDDADAILTGPPPALGTAIYGDRSLADLVSANGLEVAGDLGIAQRFCDMFRLPEAAPCPPTGR